MVIIQNISMYVKIIMTLRNKQNIIYPDTILFLIIISEQK